MTTSQVVLDQLFNTTIQKLDSGESYDEVFNFLLSCNVSEKEANMLIEQAIPIVEKHNRSQPFVSRSQGFFGIIKGLILAILGVVLSDVIEIDGMSVMFSGLVLVGVALMINGIWKTISGKDLISG